MRASVRPTLLPLHALSAASLTLGSLASGCGDSNKGNVETGSDVTDADTLDNGPELVEFEITASRSRTPRAT